MTKILTQPVRVVNKKIDKEEKPGVLTNQSIEEFKKEIKAEKENLRTRKK